MMRGLMQDRPLIIPSLLADGNTPALAFASAVGGTVGAMITTPYSAAVVALLYFDLRVRKEGLDLQLLAHDAGVERDPDAPLPAPLHGDEWTPEERAQAPYWPPPPGWKPEPRAPAPPAPPAPGTWLPPRPGGQGEP